MAEHIDIDRLKADFAKLRETETRAAPAYSPLRPAPVRTARPVWLRPTMGLAVAAGALALALAIYLVPGPTAEHSPLPAEPASLAISLDMPTDFLLDTPWFELAQTIPDFDFDMPQYDIPEESSDEI